MDNQENQELENQILKEQEREKQNQENQNQENQKTSMGLDPNIAGLLCYFTGGIAGVVFLVIEKENKFIKFHALQSIMLICTFIAVSIAYSILTLIPFIGSIFIILEFIIDFLFWAAYLVVTIILMVKSYNNEEYKLPVIGDIASKHAGA